ncbi:MAG: glycoside hydrolase family 5 protein [Spirochaetales bacterium]|nr:glycoside hydrolase family 5 protein [Spirochaetales bacterium]
MSTFSNKSLIFFLGLLALLLISCRTVSSNPSLPLPPLDPGPDAVVPATETTAAEMVRHFRVGWNLGNTFDSYSGNSYTDGWIEQYTDRSPEAYETAWGNPVTTRAVFEKVRAAGFGAVRIPVTWGPHFNPDDSINTDWMNRVEAVVKMALDSGLYCIINVHHDTGADKSTWLKASTAGQAGREARFTRLWQAIAYRFASFDGRLLFEGFNEILDDKSRWDKADDESLDAVNRLNQLFVDTVRAGGGMNSRRFLVVNTYAASTVQNLIDAFVLPSDTAIDRLIVEVHDYSPLSFTWQQEQIPWTISRWTWGSATDYYDLENRFNRLKHRFVDKGIPVILGEFCADNKRNTGERVKFARATIQMARDRGIGCFWWDAGGDFKPDTKHGRNYYSGGGLFNRRKLEWLFPELNDALVRAFGS